MMRAAVGLGILVGLVLAGQWLIQALTETSLLNWYLQNGALIGLASSIGFLAWGDLNRHVGLISAHPVDYLGSCLQLIGMPITVMGVHLSGPREPIAGASPLDAALTTILALLLTALLLGWLLLVAPLQYFVFLICGAPGRHFARSPRRTVARLERGRLEVQELAKDAPMPAGWWEASLAQKPVSMTHLHASLLFLLLNPWLS